MNVLSLFDGMSCGQIALNRLGIKYDNYFASEIDKYSIIITQKNYPNTIQLGDIKNINIKDLPKINLLMGGSPCQDLSIANPKRTGLKGNKSKLFFDFVDIKNKLKPKYFLYENVFHMKDEDKNIITENLKVNPILINSDIFSPQQRKRLYWTNINIDPFTFESKLIVNDIIDNSYSDNIYEKYKDEIVIENNNRLVGYIKNKNRGNRIYSPGYKSITLTANSGGIGSKTGLYLINGKVRRLSPLECERLQTVPDNYTEGVSDTQRYKMLGNGWTVDVIAHILKNI